MSRIVKAAERAHNERLGNYRGRFKATFKQAFGYTPELGEPEYQFDDNPKFWIEGYLWQLSNNHLLVLTTNSRWAPVRSGEEFYRLWVRGEVSPND